MTSGNTDLTRFRRRYYWQYALIVAALAYLFLWDPIRTWWIFEKRTVEVTSVQSLCAAFDADGDTPVEVGPCEALKAKLTGRTDVEIKPRTFATFTYTSPADASVRTVSVVRDIDSAGQPIASGSRLDVELSRYEPDVFRVP